MPDRAKLFKSGGSQAVRLPRAYRFEGTDEVVISRQGRRVILEAPATRWTGAFLDLAGTVEDFPYPAEPPAADPGPEL